MPLSSLLMAAMMAIFGSTFTVAQLPTVLALIGLTLTTAWLGFRMGQTRRSAWLPALLVLAGGFYFPFWGATDTFAIFGLLGALALITMSLGRQYMDWRWIAVCGGLSGLAHLTRADGLLFVLIALFLIWYPKSTDDAKKPDPPNPYLRLKMTIALIITYLLVMLPWFIRNLNVIDSPLPSGGINTAFLRGYNELFAYPVDWSAGNFWDWGLSNILQSRWEALLTNVGTFIAVETWVIVSPLVLWMFWTLVTSCSSPTKTRFRTSAKRKPHSGSSAPLVSSSAPSPSGLSSAKSLRLCVNSARLPKRSAVAISITRFRSLPVTNSASSPTPSIT
jgi:hypothetical protein